ATADAGRSIEDDHYGASFPFHFGQSAHPALERQMAAYSKRTGSDAMGYFAIGDADMILARLAEYVAAGVSKFILRPVGGTGGGGVRAEGGWRWGGQAKVA